MKNGVDFLSKNNIGTLDLLTILTELTLPQGFKGYKKIRRLPDWCQWFHIRNTSDYSGFMMSEFWDKRQFKEIENHQVEDLKKTKQIFEILKKCKVL